MKISYNRDEDILMIKLAKRNIDYAEESGGIIVHFSSEHKPVLLEILDASNFLAKTTEAACRVSKEAFVTI